MQDKIIKRRIKIGATILILFVAIVSAGTADLVFRENLITFQNVIEILDNTTSIQDAIDSITDASETNPYQILVYPGYYYENIVLKDWVSMSGTSTTGDVVITANTGTVLSWSTMGGCNTGNYSSIGNIALLSRPTTTGVQLVNITNGNHDIENCFFYAVPIGVDMISLNFTNGNTSIRNSFLSYTTIGNTTGINEHTMIRVRGASSLSIYYSEARMNIYDYDDTITFIDFNSTIDERFWLLSNTVHVNTLNTTFNGTAQILRIGQENHDTNIEGNYFHVDGSSGNGTGYCYNLTDIVNATLHSTSNRIVVDGYAFSYFAVIDGSNLVVSHFDDVVALEEVLGSGNMTAVHSHADGELHVEVINLVTKVDSSRDVSTLATGDIESLFDIVINANLSTGGMFHVLDVALSRGESLANISAIATYTGVDVIHQHIGENATLDRGMLYDGITYTNVTDSFNNTTSDVTIFSSDNDYIYVGSTTMFDNIIVVLDVTASATIFQPGQEVFEYSTGGGTWQSFSPGDDTNGFTQSGFIRFGRNSLSGWATNDPWFGALYYVRIQRTRNNIVTDPIESTIHLENVATGDYYWNAEGNISSNNVMLNLLIGALTDGDPTDAEIDAIVGSTPSNVGAGWSTYIKDNDADYLYQIISDGSDWYYINGTKAL